MTASQLQLKFPVCGKLGQTGTFPKPSICYFVMTNFFFFFLEFYLYA